MKYHLALLGSLPLGYCFNHPGLLVSSNDLSRLQEKLVANLDPWTTCWSALTSMDSGNVPYTPQAVASVDRDVEGDTAANAYLLWQDAAAAFALALRPSFEWKLAIWIGLSTVLTMAILRFDAGDAWQTYCTGTYLGLLILTAFTLFFLSDPIKEYRHETHDRSLLEMPLLQRTYNALCIIVNGRGVGWNYQVSSIVG